MRDDLPAKHEALEGLLPHGEEFRFVDRVVRFEAGRWIEAEFDLRPSESYFAGHFPGHPLMPGVLITEALAQSGGLLLGMTHRAEQAGQLGESSSPPQFNLAAVQMKFTRPVAPGITLVLFAELERDFGGLFRCKVEARVAEEVVATGSVTLAAVDSA
jgi:3-hydroxyacyl-[acyl-carrier-protein] dehydratase